MKYIVKNCPAFCDSTRQCRGAYDRKISHQYCSGNNDDNCIIKQIAELCKKDRKPIRSWTEKGTCYDGELKKIIETDIAIDEFSNDKYLADKVLDLLEIEEFDEE